jgi:hypothetical protein
MIGIFLEDLENPRRSHPRSFARGNRGIDIDRVPGEEEKALRSEEDKDP